MQENKICYILKRQRNFFASGKTRDIRIRIKYLQKLTNVIKKHEADILKALNSDLNKSEFEGYATEIGMVYEEIKFVMKHLPEWVKPLRVHTPMTQFPSISKIYSEPYGSVLIMAPWNYPFQLAIEPLIGAVAAGNCAVIKPSNYAPNTSKIIAKIIEETFPPFYVTVIQGGRETNKNLLDEHFDYIFFTGSVEVGKVVMEAAAKNLTPVSLELGGKSPCIVDETANLEMAAKRIVWGKFLNSGQTCVAPDYLLVHHEVKNELIRRMKKYLQKFYGENPLLSKDYPKIINEKHFRRLLGLMSSGNIVIGGKSNEAAGQIEPTVLDDVAWDSMVMSEEIFGPILPIITFTSLPEVKDFICKRPKPLALYYFTTSRANEKYILKNTSYGGGCVNDTIVHLASSYMPFGGVGESGMGGYHGKASFDTFSHRKSVLKKSNLLDIPLRYPPYRNRLKLLKYIMR